jgi:hypothetical protein
MNVYGYVNNDPINFIDSTGLCAVSFLDSLQNMLDLAGLVPVIGNAADLVNALISLGRGDLVGAALRGMQAIPGIGQAVLATKAAKGAAKLCFIEGTPVHTQDGLKPIEEIEIGDLVASKDEITGKTTWKPVVELFRNEDKPVLNITLVNSDDQTEVLGATPEHPFWVEGKKWVQAGELQEGDKVVSLDGGSLVVNSIVPDADQHTTYNFEVADYHTYFVGKVGALVHNQCQHELGKKVEKAFKKNSNLEKAFKETIAKGEVGSTGQAGIKSLKGHKKFSHEVKFLSKEFGDVRVFGNKLDNGDFSWTKVGNHKTL